MIDSHVHFWNYDAYRHSWIDENMKVIRRDFLPADIDETLLNHNVDGIIVVQADQSEQETEFLIQLSNQYPKILGVVGWIDLLAEHFDEKLEAYKNQHIIKGWRHIVQAEPKGFITHPTFVENVKKLGELNYTYGILVYHFQLPEVVDFVAKLPNQNLILNHLGKPDLKSLEYSHWKKQIIEISRFDNVYCKLSGLVTEAETGKWNKEMLWPYMDLVVEQFGIDKVMFGSDWPVLLLNSNYAEWLSLVIEYVEQFSANERAKILDENARKCYKL